MGVDALLHRDGGPPYEIHQVEFLALEPLAQAFRAEQAGVGERGNREAEVLKHSRGNGNLK